MYGINTRELAQTPNLPSNESTAGHHGRKRAAARRFGISRKRKKFAGRDQPGTGRGRDLEEDRAAFEDRGKCRLCVRMWWALSECGGQALSEWSFWVFSLEDPSAYWTHSSPTPRPAQISIPPKPQPFPKNVGRFSFLHSAIFRAPLPLF